MFHVVIPARRASQRLPDKVLQKIGSEPMLVHVWRNACGSGAADVVVATDDREIATVMTSAGADVAMTSAEHESGTDRIAEVCDQRGWPDGDVVVNVQGDEPLLPPTLIDQVAELLRASPQAALATLAVPIESSADFVDPNVVKVVIDENGHALLFSRAPIPFDRAGSDRISSLARRHLGIYAYRVSALKQLVGTGPVEIEKLERLEQLRALFSGMSIAVADAREIPGFGVDTPADLARVRTIFNAPH